MLKLARGHVTYELGVIHPEEPELVEFFPLHMVKRESRDSFESDAAPIAVWPEIGSRAFLRAVVGANEVIRDGWIVVQDGRYRYRVDQERGDEVRIVLSEYLGCRVVW